MIPTDEIISMAKECGLPLTYVPHDDTFSPHVDGLVAFANLVSARAAAIEQNERINALIALAFLRDRIKRIHTAALDGRPKQAYGEMVAAMVDMPEWEIVETAIRVRGDQHEQ